MSDFPHEAFLRELRALCDKHGVELQGTEDEGVLVATAKDDDYEQRRLAGENDAADVARFVYITFTSDGVMHCDPARMNEWKSMEPDYHRTLILEREPK